MRTEKAWPHLLEKLFPAISPLPSRGWAFAAHTDCSLQGAGGVSEVGWRICQGLGHCNLKLKYLFQVRQCSLQRVGTENQAENCVGAAAKRGRPRRAKGRAVFLEDTPRRHLALGVLRWHWSLPACLIPYATASWSLLGSKFFLLSVHVEGESLQLGGKSPNLGSQI